MKAPSYIMRHRELVKECKMNTSCKDEDSIADNEDNRSENS